MNSLIESYMAIKTEENTSKNTYKLKTSNTDETVGDITRAVETTLNNAPERIKTIDAEINWEDRVYKYDVVLVDGRKLVLDIDRKQFKAKCGDLEFKYEYEIPEDINYVRVSQPNICVGDCSGNTFNPMASTIAIDISNKLLAFLQTVDYLSYGADEIDKKYNTEVK